MILFIDACVRTNSRTRRLADALLSKLGDEVERAVLNEQKNVRYAIRTM